MKSFPASTPTSTASSKRFRTDIGATTWTACASVRMVLHPRSAQVRVSWDESTTRRRSAKSARGDQLLARQPARIVRSEEHGDVGHVVRLPDAPERRLRDVRFFEVGADESGRMRSFRLDDAGIDAV